MSDRPPPRGRRRRGAAASDDELAATAIGAWRAKRDRGEHDDPEEVIRANPGIAPALRRQFAAMRAAELAFGAATPHAVARPPAAWLGGRVLGRWRLGPVLGSGGMGTVFAADAGGERAAVKVLHPHLLARPEFVERFVREADIGRRVRHANVVATLEAGAADVGGETVHYLVLEHVEGRTLRAHLDETGRLPEALVRHVGREVARGLTAVHVAGAVHRDVKPENVIVTREQVVKLMDLGVARLRDDALRLSQTGAFVGSVRYGSPEQFQTPESVDARADLFSLGLVLYELATGVHPFHADGFHAIVRRVLEETPRPAAELNPQLSPFLEEVVAKLLAKDREKRFASAQEVAGVLEDGEESAWWRERAKAIRDETKRPLRRIRIARETSVYGRDAELTLLRSLYERASAGDGQVVLLEGEAGIGKSRIVDEFVSRLSQSGEDVNFLFGSYPPGGAATAAGAFSVAYREHLGDGESAIRAALPRTPILVPAFAALLRGDAAPAGSVALTKDSLQTVFVHATQSLAAERPTIVLIDDLHFAPQEGRALFAALALAVPGHRVLLVGASRPGLDEKWLRQIERLDHATRVALPRLSPKDLVRLLADSLRSTHLAEDLAGKIATKSDGNPFFVFEILHGLREGQFLTRKPDGTWATTRLIAEIQVPSSIVDLVQARVSDLSRADRNVLEVASCAGFEFDPALVGDVLRIERIPLLQTLGAIEKSHRLVRSVGRRFVFDHHQIMEVLYAGLSEPLREEYHAAIGSAIEAAGGAASKEPKDLDGALCASLSDHLLRGGQGPRALRYLDAALAHLDANYQRDGAVRLADRALAAPGLLTGTRRCDVLLHQQLRFDFLGRRDEQERRLLEALPLADATGDASLRASVRSSLGNLLHATARDAEARPALEESLALSRVCGDTKTEAAAAGNLGMVLLSAGDHAGARAMHERALALHRARGHRRGEALATGNLGVVASALGREEESLAHMLRAVELTREAGDRPLEAWAMANVARHYTTMGRLEDARSLAEQAVALNAQVGDRRYEAVSVAYLGMSLMEMGRFAGAQPHYERALAMFREVGDRRYANHAMGSLGDIAYARGDLGAALARFGSCAEESRATGIRQDEALHLVKRATVLVILGDPAGARRDAEAARATALAMGSPLLAAYADGVLSRIADEQDDAAEAERCGDAAIEALALAGQRRGELEYRVFRAERRVRAGREDDARRDLLAVAEAARALSFPTPLASAEALLASLGGCDAATALATFRKVETSVGVLDSMVLRHDLGRATGDVRHIAEAKRLLDHLVAHAPPERRGAVATNVRFHREIVAAAAAAGLPAAAGPSVPD